MKSLTMGRLLLAATVLLGAGAATAQARTTELRLKDWTGRGFLPDEVRYHLPAGITADRLRLQDAAGNPVPLQVTPGQDGAPDTLSFVTDLPAGSEQVVQLRDDGEGPQAPGTIKVEEEDGALILGNALYQLRVPAVQERRFEQPVPASNLPAPITGFRWPGAGTQWRGGGRFLLERRVRELSVQPLGRGPVFAGIRYGLAFADGGSYSAEIRVIHNVPLARVTETYDLGQPGTAGYLELDLGRGWQPETVEYASVHRNGTPDRGRTVPVASLGQTPHPLTANWAINPDNAWGPKSYLGLAGGAEGPYAGFLPLHKGQWRRYNAVEIHAGQPGQVALRLPIGVRPASWYTEASSDASPFSTGQHDPALPPTLGRRAWGLMLAAPAASGFMLGGAGASGPFGSARMWYGAPSLDTYKDYVLEWPDARSKYPRVFHDAATLAAATLAAARAAGGAKTAQELFRGRFYAISGDEDDAARNLKVLKQRLENWQKYIVHSSNPGHGNGGIEVLVLADNVLSWPGLPEAERRDIRSKLALLAYLTFEPDIMAWHAGTHMGNPNMPLGAYGTLPAFVALLPDHPMHGAWKAWLAQWLEYSVGKNIAPGGAWFEYGSYGLHGYNNIKRGLHGLLADNTPNRERLMAYDSAFWDYMLNVVSPLDPRYRMRILPGDGNSPPLAPVDFYEGAGILARHNVGLARQLLGAWHEGGADHRLQRPMRGNPERALDAALGAETVNPYLGPWNLNPEPPRLTSRLFPGFGAMLRAHPGPQETLMLLRGGFSWSHHNPNQGNIILYGRGAPLVPGQPYQYYGTNRQGQSSGPAGFAHHFENVVRFGHPENHEDYAWPDANVLEHAFGPNADYARVSVGYPDWYIHPGRDPKWNGGQPAARLLPGLDQQPGAFNADRQVLFVKGESGARPGYFVMRDTVSGPGRLAQWWNLNLLGRKDWISRDGNAITARTVDGGRLDLVFAAGDATRLELEEDEPLHHGHMFWANSAFEEKWKQGDNLPEYWVTKDGKPVGAMRPNLPSFYEQHVLLRVPGPPGGEYMVVLYPRAADEIAPRVTTLAAGVLKVETPSGTDYVFLGPDPMAWEGDGVSFRGRAGLVRLQGGRASTALLSGPGQVLYRGQGVQGERPEQRSSGGTSTGTGSSNGAAPLTTREKAGTAPVLLPPGIGWQAELTGHAQVAPGLSRAVQGEAQEYLLRPAADGALAEVSWEDLKLSARNARIWRRGDITRIVVPDMELAAINVGQCAVRGRGPFDLTFGPDKISGTVDGELRTLVTSLPPRVLRAMYHMDGVRYLCGIPDEQAPHREAKTPQFACSFAVTAGAHQVEIAAWANPGVPPAGGRRSLTF